MATLKDYRDERLRKLEELKKLGVNPYPAKAERTHDLAQIVIGFRCSLQAKRLPWSAGCRPSVNSAKSRLWSCATKAASCSSF